MERGMPFAVMAALPEFVGVFVSLFLTFETVVVLYFTFAVSSRQEGEERRWSTEDAGTG